jgi:hypothetical protein
MFVIRRAYWLAPLLLTSCVQMPETYAPPVQRQPIEAPRPYRIARVVNMNDPDAEARFVKDISKDLAGSWRWCVQKPTVKIKPRTNENLKYTIDFTLPEVTFKDTGPVTMSFWVGDHLVDRIKYDQFGQKHFEKPIPSDWVKPNEEILIAAEIDKVWVAKEDGARLGFILTRIGLTQ